MYCTMFKVCNRIKHQLLLLGSKGRVVKGKEREREKGERTKTMGYTAHI